MDNAQKVSHCTVAWHVNLIEEGVRITVHILAIAFGLGRFCCVIPFQRIRFLKVNSVLEALWDFQDKFLDMKDNVNVWLFRDWKGDNWIINPVLLVDFGIIKILKTWVLIDNTF
jgi:hypothetical protein